MASTAATSPRRVGVPLGGVGTEAWALLGASEFGGAATAARTAGAGFPAPPRDGTGQ